MELTFSGKRAVVTGAGKGIGRDVAKALVKYGAETYAVSKTQANLDTLKAEVPAIKTVCVDLSDWDATQKAMHDIGHVHLLVNNAGVSDTTPVTEPCSPQRIDRVLDVNVKAVVNVTQVFANKMVDSGSGGSIVNVSSQAAQVALPGHLIYAASKGALDAMTRVMALELGPHQIRVNSVQPTVIMTAMGRQFWTAPETAGPMLAKIPLGRFGEIEEVVGPILFLLSDQASMINGTCLPIDGGVMAC